MARRKSTAKRRHAFKQREAPEYGMALSRERLAKDGFHPAVTDMTPDQIITAWTEMVQKTVHDPLHVTIHRATRASPSLTAVATGANKSTGIFAS